MKSGKQRRFEIKEKRRKRAKENADIDVYSNIENMPKGGIKANIPDFYARHGYYNEMPLFYIDREYVCKDCKSHEIWTAKQQKWWYETANGHIDSVAVRCRPCRKVIRDQKFVQKMQMELAAQRIPHPNEAFFKKK